MWITDVAMSPPASFWQLQEPVVTGIPLQWRGPITHYTGLLTTDSVNQMFWDDDNHLYAIANRGEVVCLYRYSDEAWSSSRITVHNNKTHRRWQFYRSSAGSHWTMVEMGLEELSSSPISRAGCQRETYGSVSRLFPIRFFHVRSGFSAGGVLPFSARTV